MSRARTSSAMAPPNHQPSGSPTTSPQNPNPPSSSVLPTPTSSTLSTSACRTIASLQRSRLLQETWLIQLIHARDIFVDDYRQAHAHFHDLYGCVRRLEAAQHRLSPSFYNYYSDLQAVWYDEASEAMRVAREKVLQAREAIKTVRKIVRTMACIRGSEMVILTTHVTDCNVGKAGGGRRIRCCQQSQDHGLIAIDQDSYDLKAIEQLSAFPFQF